MASKRISYAVKEMILVVSQEKPTNDQSHTNLLHNDAKTILRTDKHMFRRSNLYKCSLLC